MGTTSQLQLRTQNKPDILRKLNENNISILHIFSLPPLIFKSVTIYVWCDWKDSRYTFKTGFFACRGLHAREHYGTLMCLVYLRAIIYINVIIFLTKWLKFHICELILTIHAEVWLLFSFFIWKYNICSKHWHALWHTTIYAW